MDYYHILFRYETGDDRKRGWGIDRKLNNLLEKASVEEKPEIDGGLQGLMIGVRAIEEKIYQFGIEGSVKVSTIDALEFYGKAVYLEHFDQNNPTYLNLKEELESVGFKLNQELERNQDKPLELKNLGLKEMNKFLKGLEPKK